ncbi:flagellar basal body-associated FliL family protein [Viridibacterium curvum]|uniref:Flagellar protein FliL n=1 Tax=Viridibacterium curvum TaxID=1101404 RepID=A0ABP9QB77_9RHOO
MQFTVNVGPFTRETPTGGGILQVTLVLHAAKPEAQHELDLYKPMITHHIHLTINGFSIKELRAPDGKDQLADAIIERVNKVLKLDEKTGIDDVFFTSFILQGN